MTKSNRICFLYTDTNGLHELNENVSKKNLFGFARLVSLNYNIGYVELGKFISELQKNIIIKPKCMHISNESIEIHGITNIKANELGQDIEDTLNLFLEDIKNINIIVSHNIIFHLRTIQAELIRYNIQFNFKKYIIIDTINFFHNYSFPKLKDLYTKLTNKNPKNKTTLELISKCFFILYNKFEESIVN
jgi:DNA polymerase III epsilon subunit-like protein